MKTSNRSFLMRSALGALAFTGSLSLNAASLPVYSMPINWSSPACAGLGDVVSCSAPALNVLNGLAANTSQPTGYVLDTSQGLLKNAIVVNAGGAAALDNQDAIPLAGAVDNGFKANVGNANYFKMGENVFEGSGGGAPLGDQTDTWDVSIKWLIDALTIGGVRRDMVIGFDFNQPQNGVGALDIWSLITVRDVDGSNGNQVFELNRSVGNPFTFNSAHTFNDAPKSTDFVRVTNSLCVKPNGGNDPTAVQAVSAAGTCPSGYQKVDNAQSTSSTEFLNLIPELNAGLERLLMAGYDTISVDVWMGCFGTKDNRNNPNAPTLADGGTNSGCDAGGFGDIFLMAGYAESTVPEPGTLALLGVACLGFAYRRVVRKA